MKILDLENLEKSGHFLCENSGNPGNSSGEIIGLKFIRSESELFRTIPSHFESIRKTFCISFGEKCSKINPIQSKPSFQSESI